MQHLPSPPHRTLPHQARDEVEGARTQAEAHEAKLVADRSRAAELEVQVRRICNGYVTVVTDMQRTCNAARLSWRCRGDGYATGM